MDCLDLIHLFLIHLLQSKPLHRFHQILFIVSLAGISWLGMMAFHELGHVCGAVLTGATIERVVLSPLTISRTDIGVNPNPALVVWMGPVLGCVLPLTIFAMVPQRNVMLRQVAQFFAGFCLIANGSYIAVGAIDRVGDCRQMLDAGSPLWTLCAFGALTIPVGFWLWHRLGSAKQFLLGTIAIWFFADR